MIRISSLALSLLVSPFLSPPLSAEEKWLASDIGVEFFGSYTIEAWRNPSGGQRQESVITDLFEFGAEVDLEKLVGWQGATVRHAGFLPLGQDLSEEAVGNLLTISNAAASRSHTLYELYELWFQQNLWDDRFSLRFGQLAADTEFATTEAGALFLNSTFGWPPFLSENLNGGGPAFPKGAPGVRLAVEPMKGLSLQTAFYQENTWLNEVQYRWNASEEAEGLPGEAKLGGWSQGSSGKYGVYLILEQMVYRKTYDKDRHEEIRWFSRAATNPRHQNFFGFYFDSGLNWKGALPGRHDDALGVAFAYAELTKEARQSLREGGRQPGAEMLLELTYRCQIKPWLAVQPDIQYVIHPGATTNFKNAWVIGLRTTMSF